MRLAILALLICPFSANAQEYYWKVVTEKEYHQSAVEINTATYMGTGVIVKVTGEPDANGDCPGVVLTCLHVAIWDNNSGTLTVTYRNGRILQGKIIKWDAAHDLCVISTTIPKGYKAAEFSDTPCAPGDVLEAVGLGGGIPINSDQVRRFELTAGRLTDSSTILCDDVVVPGDSGGPAFKNGKLIGIISAGCRDEQVLDPSGLGFINGYWGAVIIPITHGADICFKD